MYRKASMNHTMITDTATQFTTDASIMQSRPTTALFIPSPLKTKFQQLDFTHNKTNSTDMASKTSKFTSHKPKVSSQLSLINDQSIQIN